MWMLLWLGTNIHAINTQFFPTPIHASKQMPKIQKTWENVQIASSKAKKGKKKKKKKVKYNMIG